jgi:uncharacterized protein
VSFYFLDTSALVKRYVVEIGTPWVLSLVAPAAGHTLLIAQITRAELVSAAARRRREGQIQPRTAHAIRLIIDRHASREYRVVGLGEKVVMHAEDLLEAHPLRAYDAIQLASALESSARLAAARLSPLVFVSSDKQLLAVASAEGLATDNPESHL